MDALRIERDDDVLRITFARPESRNAFDATLIGELAEAFVDVGKARAVVLAGEGPSFCAGADIEWMRRSATLSHDENVADANALRRMLDAIDTCPAPVVALVQGHALGGGAGLVATADVALAHERTVFAFSEVKLGIIPAVISPYALRKIGESAARRYFVTGERFDAATALRIGLVHEVTTDLEARSPRCSASSAPQARARRGTPSASCSTGRTGRRPPAGSPSDGRATRGRRAFAPSSSGSARPGRRRSRTLLDGAPRARLRRPHRRRGLRRRHRLPHGNGIRVAAFVAVVGLPFALAVSIAYGAEHVGRADVTWSVLAGIAVAVGFGCFYTAMGRG